MPVLRNAEAVGFLNIEKGIAELGKKARDGKLTIEDLAGDSFPMFVSSSFSVGTCARDSRGYDSSNSGVLGSLFGTSIINLPQAAVFGTHAIKDEPVVVNGRIFIRPIMVVTLTYDHRLMDSREAITFLG